MTRFWITLQQSVDFVLQCLENMVGGELFVPKIPSMKIIDIAKAIAPECKTKDIGIRPGEKLHEIMVTKDDARSTLEFETYYVIQPDFTFWGSRFDNTIGKPVPEGFEYNSENNTNWLSIDDLKEMINDT